jgi:hypothetical protein
LGEKLKLTSRQLGHLAKVFRPDCRLFARMKIAATLELKAACCGLQMLRLTIRASAFADQAKAHGHVVKSLLAPTPSAAVVASA